MIYRGPAFVAVVSYGMASRPPPPPPHPPSASCRTFQSSFVSPVELNARGEGGGGGAKSYDSEKVGSSINHSVLPGPGDPGYKPSRCN